MALDKLPVPTEQLEANDQGATFLAKMTAIFTAIKNATIAYNRQIDSHQLATSEADRAREEADRAALIVLDPLLQIRQILMDDPLCRLFTKSALSPVMAGNLTVSRATPASFIDTYGGVKQAPIDQPRLERNGYLFEAQSTNLLLHSEDLAAAAWVTSPQFTVNTDSETAPDGTLSADAIIPSDGFDSYNSGICSQTATTTPNATVTLSAFIRPVGNVAAVRLQPYSSSSGNNASLTVRLSDGAIIGEAVAKGTFSNASATVQKVRHNYLRISLTFTSGASNSITCRWFPYNDDLTPFIGDGSSGLAIWGAQLEELPFPSSYIATNTNPVARLSDEIKLPAEGNIPCESAGQSVVVNIDKKHFIEGAEVVWSAGTIDDDYRLYFVTIGGQTVLRFEANRVEIAERASYDLPTQSLSATVVVTFNGSHATMFVNGELADSFTTGKTALDILTEPVYIGSQGGTGFIAQQMHISDFRVYDFALNADEVKFLSGVRP